MIYHQSSSKRHMPYDGRRQQKTMMPTEPQKRLAFATAQEHEAQFPKAAEVEEVEIKSSLKKYWS